MALVLASPCSSAFASDRWEEAGSGAVAILPVPSRATAITGGSLACAEQRWSLRLRTEPRPAGPPLAAKVTIDRSAFAVAAEYGTGVFTVAVSSEMLEALKASSRLAVVLGPGTEAPQASFALRGSQKVIEAIAPRCSPVDLGPFQPVTLSETDAAAALAEPLLAGEVKLFRAATSGTPKLAAARVDRGEGREMLFASLCGSSWYYGRSGCSLFGYLRGTPTAEWRTVYNTEGMALYVDPSTANAGWPNLVTLEMPGGVTPIHWKWNGEAYELRDPQVAVEGLPAEVKDP